MSITYNPLTNYAAKDTLPANNADKVVRGVEFTAEFEAISSAFATAAPAANPTFTGNATFDTLSATGTASMNDMLVQGIITDGGAASINFTGGGASLIADFNIDASPLGLTTPATVNTTALSLNGVAVTATAAELNIMDGVTATTAELNILDGVTATAVELNYVDGVTSGIQAQLDTKAPIASPTFTGTSTVPSLVLATGATVTSILDEDDLASNSATALATQQSIKAYVDDLIIPPGTVTRQQFTGDGTTTVFTLAADLGSLGASLQAFIDGVYQEEAGYTVAGTALTFSEAPPVDSTIETVAFAVAPIGETAANLVSYTPAGAGAVASDVQTKLRESVSVKDFGAVGDGMTDDTAAIQAAIDYVGPLVTGGGEVILPAGVYWISSTITIPYSSVALNFTQGSRLKAIAAMPQMLEIGDGLNRKEEIMVIGSPYFDANNLADYCIRDRGTRISSILDAYFLGFSEYAVISQPETFQFSEFLKISRCQSFDGKGFYKHLATGPTPFNGRGTDSYISENTCFRPTEWFASIDTAQRFVFTDNMVGSQSNAFLGGILITASDTNTGPVTAEHVIDGLYVESNNTFGAGMIGVNIQNQSATKIVAGCTIDNIKMQPVNITTLVKFSTPAAGGSRQHTVSNFDSKGGNAQSVVVESNVAYTRIHSKNTDGNLSNYVTDAGTFTVINGVVQELAGKATPPTRGATGDLIHNISNDSFWTKDHSNVMKQIGFGSIVYSETRDLPSIAAGGNLVFDVTVTGVTLGDYVLTALEQNLSGLIVHAYARTGIVSVSVFNPTAAPIDIASTKLRFLVFKH